MRHTLFFLASLFLLLSACNVFIEKRHYNKGYHVQWNKKKRVTKSDGKEDIMSTKKQTIRIDELVQNEQDKVTTVKEIIKVEQVDDPEHTIYKIATADQNTVIEKKEVETKLFEQTSKKYSSKRLSVAHKSLKESSNREQNNLWLYSLLAGMFATTYSLLRVFRKGSMRISRWASRNKKVTRGAIFAGHVGLGALGFYVGKSFGQMGIEFTLGSQYALGGTFFLGSAFLYHLEKKGVGFATWKSFFSHRLGHLVAGVSLFGLMMGAGNSFYHGNDQVSVVGNAITYIAGDNEPNDENSTQITEENNEPSGMAIFGAVVVGILILLLTAVGACAAACNDQGFLAAGIVILGLALTILAVRAILKNG